MTTSVMADLSECFMAVSVLLKNIKEYNKIFVAVFESVPRLSPTATGMVLGQLSDFCGKFRETLVNEKPLRKQCIGASVSLEVMYVLLYLAKEDQHRRAD